jgi:hypothetical protein
VTHLLTFALGIACGWLLGWWPLSRPMARWLGSASSEWPQLDAYLDDLAAILERERW